MGDTLLAWNFPYPTSQLVGDAFLTGSRRISYLPHSPLSGADISANPGFDFFALPMPQAGSSKIVFTSNRDGNAQIYSMNADGSGLIRLTTNVYNDDHPRWSPNGTTILFQSDRDNPETGNYDIYVMNVNGTGQTRLTFDAADDSAAEWSPDGSKIVFQSLRNGQYYQVYVMNADGTNQINTSGGFAADSQPSWSPDGSKIAFTSERDHAGRTEVYVMNANGSNQTRLTVSGDPFRDEQPAWSRDGTKIAFVSTRDSVIETWQETDDDGAILNRSRIRTNKEIYKMNADGSNQIRLTNILENDDSPYWSPDGTQIIFRSERERDSYDPAQQLWTMNADGTNPAIINSNEFGNYSASWKSTSNQPPVASSAGPYSSFNGSPIQFNGGGSFDPDGAIAGYQWNFGDNTSGAGITPTHSYSTVGSYTVTLTVTDNDGASASATATATVANNPPVAHAGGPYSGVTAQNIPFSGSGSSDADGTITSYAWSFGDGGTGSGAVPTHAYTSAGTYTVTLTVTDNQGAQASANTSVTITVAGSEQYLANFNLSALARPPLGDESAYWNDMLRAAYQNGQGSMLLAVRELGKTLFESSEYAARNDRQGTQHNVDYVYDLYKTYLMREPDGPGWAFWTNNCNSYGREEVRRAFDESGEFANIVATLAPVGSPSSTVSSLASARVDPFNQSGNGLASRDAQWSVPLLSLPGRSGLDLGLSLSYSSMVWTRSGPYIYFDEDNGTPSPGFRLGFPTIQEKVFDAQAGDNVYVLVAGTRVSLRQVGTSNVYEAADSSFLQLIDNGGSLLVRSTDGRQLSYLKFNNEWHCTQIKDRNGNYMTVNYDWRGDIQNITDTLGRAIRFVYDTNNNPQCITQGWNGEAAPTTCGSGHTWVSFGWDNLTVQPSLGDVVGTYSGETVPVLKMVALHDGTYTKFLYNGNGQVERVTQYASDSNPLTDNHPRSYTAFDYNSPTDDCPRLNATRTWAENWTGLNGVPTEVTTSFSVEGDTRVLTAPDGTVYKETYGGVSDAAWMRGLVKSSEVLAGGVQQKLSTIAWSQDNPSVNFKTNPRVTQTIISDGANVRKTTIDYSVPAYAQYGLPYIVREYAADGTTILRETFTDYKLDQPYLDQRIIGLVSAVNLVSNGYQAKVTYGYDDPTRLSAQANTATMHDQNFDANFTTRGNVTSVSRWDVTDMNTIVDPAKALTTFMNYNAAGSVVSATDPAAHTNQVSYADSFADGNNGRNTFAYPTTVTDADNFSSTIQYNFDFGAKTRVEGPPPQDQPNGIQQTFAYDAAARLERATTLNTGAYTHYVYGPTYVQTFSSVNTVAANYAASDLYTGQFFDGLGRTYVVSRNHPGSVGGYSAVITVYDRMGRAVQQSNPTEITGAGVPAGDDAYNAQTGEGDWRYTSQTYDWQGRPRITTNPDGTTKEASYSGCGCAGGAVVTLTDEMNRQQKIYSDVLGRAWKTEVWTWPDPNNNNNRTVYSTNVSVFNARDQVLIANQYSGSAPAEASSTNTEVSCPTGTCQKTSMAFDGYARLRTKHVPEQDAGTATVWEYNDDDTVKKVTDARGASASYGYNNHRHLVNSITYSTPAGIASTPNLSFAYDAVGNRTSMTDGSGSVTYRFDQLSRMNWEERTFIGVTGSYRLTYAHNLANQLASIIDPFGAQVGYTHDASGRLNNVTGSGYANVSTYASNLQYRAWGALKSLTYGNNLTFAASYNSRLQGTQFEVAGRPPQFGASTVMTTQFDYYADGALKYAHDLLDERFDRAFSYDHTTMVKEAYSGSESRDYVNGTNSGTQTGPYRQSYQRDPFGNLTQRNNRFWSQTDTLATSHINNRNQDTLFNYDPAGNLLQDGNLQYSYDAAGRNTMLVSPESNNRSIVNVYDGDGQVLKRTEAQAGTTAIVSYYLRSSVLDGNIITELDQSGQKFKGHVFAGGDLLATQQNSQITWRHENPLTGSSGYSGIAGGYAPEAEPDPTGVNIGFGDPNILLLEPNDETMPALFGSFSPGKCKLDGMSIDCAWAMEMMAGGSAVQCPNNDCGPQRYDLYDRDGKHIGPINSQPFQAFGNGFSGYLPVGVSYVEDGFILNSFWTGGDSEKIAFDDLEFGSMAQGLAAFFISGPQSKKKRRQRPRTPERSNIRVVDFTTWINQHVKIEHFTPPEESWIRYELEGVLTNKCSQAFAAGRVRSPTATILQLGLTIRPARDLFNYSAKQLGLSQQGFLDSQKNIYSAQGGTIFGTDGAPQIYLPPDAFHGNSWFYFSLGEVLAHELIHGGGQGPWPADRIRHDLAGFPQYKSIINACRR